MPPVEKVEREPPTDGVEIEGNDASTACSPKEPRPRASAAERWKEVAELMSGGGAPGFAVRPGMYEALHIRHCPLESQAGGEGRKIGARLASVALVRRESYIVLNCSKGWRQLSQ